MSIRNKNRTVGELVDLLREVDPSLEIEYWSVCVDGQLDSTDQIFWVNHDGTSSMRFMDFHEKAILKCLLILCPNPFVKQDTINRSIRDAIDDKSHRKALKMAAKKPLKEWTITDLMLLWGVGVKTAGKMLVQIHSS